MSRPWFYTTEHFARWQLDNLKGFMLAIVERPQVDPANLCRWLPDWPFHIPVGWTWRNCFAGPGRWCLTLGGAKQRAEVGAIIANSTLETDEEESDDEENWLRG